jgi:hypothetical protein
LFARDYELPDLHIMQHLLFGLFSAFIGINLLAVSAAQEKGSLPTFDQIHIEDVFVENDSVDTATIPAPLKDGLMEAPTTPSAGPSNLQEDTENISTITPSPFEITATTTPSPTISVALEPTITPEVSPTATGTPSPTPMFNFGTSIQSTAPAEQCANQDANLPKPAVCL